MLTKELRETLNRDLQTHVDDSQWEEVHRILFNNNINDLDLTYDNNVLIYRACEEAQTEIVRFLLECPEVDFNCLHDYPLDNIHYDVIAKSPLMVACDHGNIGVIELLLRMDIIELHEEYCLTVCAMNGFIKVAHMIITHSRSNVDLTHIQRLFWTSCCHDKLNMANYFLTLFDEEDYGDIINFNSDNYHCDIVLQMSPLAVACKYGNDRIIRYLLAFPMTDVSCGGNEALYQLIGTDDCALVHRHLCFILDHRGFKPIVSNRRILEFACIKQQTFILEEYNKRYAGDIMHSGLWHSLLKFCCEKNLVNISTWIFDNIPSINIVWNNYDILKTACSTGNNRLIELCLSRHSNYNYNEFVNECYDDIISDNYIC